MPHISGLCALATSSLIICNILLKLGNKAPPTLPPHSLNHPFKKYSKVYSVPVFPMGLNNTAVVYFLIWEGQLFITISQHVLNVTMKKLYITASRPLLEFRGCKWHRFIFNRYFPQTYKDYIKLIQVPELLQRQVLVNLGRPF